MSTYLLNRQLTSTKIPVAHYNEFVSHDHSRKQSSSLEPMLRPQCPISLRNYACLSGLDLPFRRQRLLSRRCPGPKSPDTTGPHWCSQERSHILPTQYILQYIKWRKQHVPFIAVYSFSVPFEHSWISSFIHCTFRTEYVDCMAKCWW